MDSLLQRWDKLKNKPEWLSFWDTFYNCNSNREVGPKSLFGEDTDLAKIFKKSLDVYDRKLYTYGYVPENKVV